MNFSGKSGAEYILKATPFDKGGEAEIYDVICKPDLVAKLYKADLNTPEREYKLFEMVANPPNESVLKQIAWPLDVLYDDKGSFAGFVMLKINQKEDLNVIYEYPPSKFADITWAHKIQIAGNLCAVVDAVHLAGHVIGDFNPKNIKVDPEKRSYINGRYRLLSYRSRKVSLHGGHAGISGDGNPEENEAVL